MQSIESKIIIFGLLFAQLSVFTSPYHNPTCESVALPQLISSCDSTKKHIGWTVSYLKGTESFDHFGNYGPLFAPLGEHNFFQLCRLYPSFTALGSQKMAGFIKNICAGSFASVTTAPGGSLVVNNPIQPTLMGLYLDGRVDSVELDPQVVWPIGKTGISAFARLPLRFSSVSGLKFVSAGILETSFAKAVNENISPALVEMGIQPLGQSAKINSLGDIKLGIAWAGELGSDEPEFEKVPKCRLGVMGAFIFPTSTFSGAVDQNLVALPAGGNGSLGVQSQVDVQIFAKSAFVLEALLESKVYFQMQQSYRAKLFPEQTLPYVLPPVEVSFDNGSFWRIYSGVRAGKDEGFFGTIGYSYLSREAVAMTLSPRQAFESAKYPVYRHSNTDDLNFISTLASTNFVEDQSKKLGLEYSNETMAADQSFVRQYAHAMHLVGGFRGQMARIGRFSVIPCDVNLRVGLAYPFFGKNFMIAPAITISAMVNF